MKVKSVEGRLRGWGGNHGRGSPGCTSGAQVRHGAEPRRKRSIVLRCHALWAVLTPERNVMKRNQNNGLEGATALSRRDMIKTSAAVSAASLFAALGSNFAYAQG